MARKISCDWVTRIDKYVTFAPFGVDMLNIKELTFPGDTVDCWMDIQRGRGPFAPTVSGIVPIGEKVTIVIYIRDRDSTFDIHVKDCYAYDSPSYNNPNVRAIQLTDSRGCAIKEKLIRSFYRTRDVRNSGATIIAYGVVNAFKFPEAMDVFLACNVEVCKGGCDSPCQPEVQVAGGEGVDDTGGPFTAPPFDPQEKPEEDEGMSTTPMTSTTTQKTSDSDDDSDDEDSKSEGSDGNDSESTTSGGNAMTTTKTTEMDNEDEEDSESEPTSSTSAPSEATTEEESEEDEDEPKPTVSTVSVNKRRAKLSKRRNTGAKVTSRQRPKPKAKITKRSKTKKSQKLTTSSTSSTNKRAKRSLLIANGITNATFNDMIHSFSIISPLEDMDDQDLQYVKPNLAANNAEFSIPVDKCGTNTVDIDGEDGTPPKRGFENIVVFQNDPTYQEVYDHARMVVCRYTLDDDFDLKEKRVVFRPVVIDMLDVVSIPVRDADGEQTRVDCWMEITKGRFPQTSPIDSAVKVGSPLTLAIFVRDPRKRTDLRVKDCYAYDDPQVAESNGPALLQLTDFDGCPTKPKLIEVWRRTHDAGPTGATIIAFTTVT
ncbi:unnamed protein product, partial [Oppiella nova]